ncbi:MAG: hypothetical protein PHD95_06270 [Candidatus ainarchaeum sp.]|nr:hypothetical protein [Candidatus ainarchaeum sp.]
MPRIKKNMEKNFGLRIIEKPGSKGESPKLGLDISPDRVKMLLEEIKVPSLKALKEK